MIAYATAPILAFRSGDLIDAGGGAVAVVLPGGDTVLSVQPDGSFQTRPRNAIGAWEMATKSGDKLVFGGTGHLYVVPIIEGL